MAIYNILKQHKARVNVSIDGLAASIASVIAMAGDEINMAANSMMMIHDAQTLCIGSAEDLRAAADMMEKVNSTIVTTYASRPAVDRANIIDLMHKETWMTADEALGHGLVDKLSGPVQMAAHFDLSKFKYKNIPGKSGMQAGGSLEHHPAIRQKVAAMQIAVRKFQGRWNAR